MIEGAMATRRAIVQRPKHDRLDGACAAASSLLFADEIRGFVRITRSRVDGDLRIRAERAAHVNAISIDVVRRDAIGRFYRAHASFPVR
jgi:hypothetical protein